MSKDEILLKEGALYLLDEYEGAVFMFTDTGKGNYCTVKFKGKQPYKVECTTNIACEAYLGGDIITKEQFEKY